MSDLECPFDMICWTLLATDAALNPKERRCMKRAYYNDTFEFGWISQYRHDSDNIKANGQVCKSGFAYQDPTTLSKAICSKVYDVYSDKGMVTTTMSCTALGVGATCDYFFSDFHYNVYMFGPC